VDGGTEEPDRVGDARRERAAPHHPRIAAADLEWTGELAGAGGERLWAFAVQLTQGQTPALFVPPGEDPLEDSSTWNSSQGDGDPSLAEARDQLEDLDIGMLSTVRIGAWHKTT